MTISPIHIGLDLGGTNIKAVALKSVGTQLDPSPILRSTSPTEAVGGPQHVSDRLVSMVEDITKDLGPVATIGLGVPGLFASDGTIELFPNMAGPWKGFNIVSAVGSKVGITPTLINDARAFTLAEGTVGAGRGAAVMLGVVLGTGIGGGVMINGRLHIGANGLAGEFAHQIVEPNGPECGCGNNGCVETLARGDFVAGSAGFSDTKALYVASARGDERAVAAINKAAGYIAIGISNAVALLGVDVVVIGGGIANGGDVVINPIRDAVRQRVTLASPDHLHVVQGILGSEAGAIGAALIGARPRS
jgi:glucokinase